MKENPTYFRIFHPDPADDFVTKRNAAIKSIKENMIKKKTYTELIILANDLSAGLVGLPMSNILLNEVEKKIQKQSPAFTKKDKHVEILVCTLIATMDFLTSSKYSSEYGTHLFAAALWSSLTFQTTIVDPKLSDIRSDLIIIAKDVVASAASAARQRNNVKSTQTAATPEEAINLNNLAISALKRNSRLDREELNLLWWTIAERSTVFDKNLSELPPGLAAIVCGMEVAGLLSSFPADAHKHITIRNLSADGKLTLSQVLTDIEDAKDGLVGQIRSKFKPASAKHVFPLISCLLGQAPEVLDLSEKRNISEWASRSLLEFSLLRLIDIG